jgi:phosphoglycolate phosphatase
MKQKIISAERNPLSLTPPKGILFDMDGTLVQIHPAGRMLVLNETLADFGLPPLTDMETVETFWFTSARYKMIDSWGIERAVFWEAFDCERLLQLQIDNTYAFEDVGEALTKLYEQGFKLAIVSNSAHISLDQKLDLLSQCLDPAIFSVVVSCNDDVRVSKPAPDGVLLTLEKLDLLPEEVILVGDSLDDIGAGAAAGVPVAIVDRGQMPTIRQRIQQEELPYHFDELATLHDLPQKFRLGKLPPVSGRKRLGANKIVAA